MGFLPEAAKKVFVALLVLVFAGGAMAQTDTSGLPALEGGSLGAEIGQQPETPPPPKEAKVNVPKISVSYFVDQVVGENNGIVAQIKGMSHTFVGAAKYLLSGIVLIMIFNGLYNRFIGSSLEEVLGDGLRGLIAISIPFAAISNWDLVVNTLYDGTLAIAKSLAPGGELNVLKLAKSFWDSVKLDDIFKSSDQSGSWQLITAINNLSRVFYWAIILVICGVAGIYMLLSIFSAIFLPLTYLAVGTVFGPLLIVWMPLRSMSDLASRWISYMIANAMTVAVASLLLKAANGIISNTTKMAGEVLSSDITGSSLIPFAAIISLALMMVIIGYLLGQADEMARGMTGGAAIGGGMIGRAAGAIMGSGAGRIAGAAGKAAGALGGGAGRLGAATAGLITKPLGNAISNKLAPAFGAFVAGKAKHGSRQEKAGVAVMKALDALGKGVASAPKAAVDAASSVSRGLYNDVTRNSMKLFNKKPQRQTLSNNGKERQSHDKKPQRQTLSNNGKERQSHDKKPPTTNPK